MSTLDTLRAWARRIKRDAVTLWFAAHPGAPSCIPPANWTLSPNELNNVTK